VVIPPAVARHRIGEWFRGTVNRRILAAALTVGSAAVVVKATAMFKELAVAYRFGTGDVVDAFLIAFLVPSLIVNVVAGTLTSAFTPVYIEVRETQGSTVAHRLFRNTMAASAVLVLGVTGLLVALMPLAWGVIASGFSVEKLALTRSLFLLLVPIILLNALVTLWSAALNAEECFAWAGLAPACVPLLTLITILVAARTWGIYSLAFGMLFGYLAQCALLVVVLKRERMPMSPWWDGATPELRRVALQYAPMVAGALLASGSFAIGQAMAAMLPAGSVAALNYGNKVVAMISEIGSMAIATAVLPHFSVMVARREWSAIRKTLRVYSRLIAVAAVPATVLLILGSKVLVRVLFERGAFTTQDTSLVATVQALYLLQVPFVMWGILLVRLASSLQKNQILLIGATITLPLNVVLNLALMRWLGVAGIALSTSVVYVVSCCYLVISVTRALRLLENS
jgi:putative peptidoglycan lipid II flippase